jgi:hypothetical protein
MSKSIASTLTKLFLNNNNNNNNKNKKKTKSSKKRAHSLKKKKKTKTLKKKPQICAPFVDSKNHNGSCFDKDVLLILIEAWNKSHKDNKIKVNKNDTHSKLWNKLGDKMSSKCSNEFCWTKQPFIKNTSKENSEIVKENFLPSRPKEWKKNPTEWLDTNNIFDVMAQYEVKYPDYRFFGPVPIDFDLKDDFNKCVVSELCHINIKSLYDKNIRKLGVIFNLDKHTQGGSHWIGMYMDINKKIIGYWDSYGYTPPNEVTALMNELKTQAKEDLNIKCNIKINKNRHQYKSSECGVYSMNFIVEQLKGKSFESVCNTIIKDDKMLAKRQKFFNYIN